MTHRTLRIAAFIVAIVALCAAFAIQAHSQEAMEYGGINAGRHRDRPVIRWREIPIGRPGGYVSPKMLHLEFHGHSVGGIYEPCTEVPCPPLEERRIGKDD
jgi:hypothetical protein